MVHFVEYCPTVFSYLRYLSGVHNRDYIEELSGVCVFLLPDFQLSDCSCSEGSSGALFVNSRSQRFIIKFVNQSEYKVLRCILHDLTIYLTEQLQQDLEAPADPLLSSEVQQAEDDMRETEAEAPSSLPGMPLAPSFHTESLHHSLSAEGVSDDGDLRRPLLQEKGAHSFATLRCRVSRQETVHSCHSLLAGRRESLADGESEEPVLPVSEGGVPAGGADGDTVQTASVSPTPQGEMAGTRSYSHPSLDVGVSPVRGRRRLVGSRAGQGVSLVGQGVSRTMNSVSHSVNESMGESMNQSMNQTVNESMNQSINLPINPSMSQSMNPSMNPLFNESINQPMNQSINPSINPSFNQPVNQPINPSLNPSINQPLNPSINQPLNTSLNPSINTLNPSYHSIHQSSHSNPARSLGQSSQPAVSQYGSEVAGSFLNKYFGVYSLEVFGSKLFFVVMENILPRCGVTDVYDLKGSWIDRNPREYHYGQVLTCMYCNTSFRFGGSSPLHSRTGRDEQCAMSPYSKHDVATTKKDNSYRARVIVDKEVNQQISNRLREDVEFLMEHDLMDYSVLIGITNVQHVVRDSSRFCFPKSSFSLSLTQQRQRLSDRLQNARHRGTGTFLPRHHRLPPEIHLPQATRTVLEALRAGPRQAGHFRRPSAGVSRPHDRARHRKGLRSPRFSL